MIRKSLLSLAAVLATLTTFSGTIAIMAVGDASQVQVA